MFCPPSSSNLQSHTFFCSNTDIGSSAGDISAADAERELLHMVKTNTIAATIDDATQMVRFLDDQEVNITCAARLLLRSRDQPTLFWFVC